MNVFKKISSSNIFATEKKKTTVQIPESAQKFDIKQENCFFLVDYEVRGDGLLICKISQDKGLLKSSDSKRLNLEVKECMVKEKFEMKELWIGKEYCFVNMACLDIGEHQNTDSGNGNYAADRIFMVNGANQSGNTHKSKRN